MKKKITSPFLRIAVLLLALVLVADVCVPGFAVFAEDNTSITGDAAAVEGDNTSIDGEDAEALNNEQNPETPANLEDDNQSEETPANLEDGNQSEETPADSEENGNQPEENPEEQPVSCQEGCEGETCTVVGCTCACHLGNTSTDGEEESTEDEVPSEPEEENPDESEDEIPEEEAANPVQELVDRLLAATSLEEMNAMMESFTDEEWALLEQITEEQNAALSAKMEELGAYDVDTMENRSYEMAPGASKTVSISNISSSGFSYTSTNNGITVALSSSGWYTDGYTISVGSNVAAGTYKLTVTYKTNGHYELQWVEDSDGNGGNNGWGNNGWGNNGHYGRVWVEGTTVTDTVTVKVVIEQYNASIFYLKTPTCDPNSNKTSEWGAQILEGVITKAGATYADNKNNFDPIPYVVRLASDMVKQDDGSWLMPNNSNYSSHYKAIYDAYKAELEDDLGISGLKQDDIEAIYLTPYKNSQNNGVESGKSNYEDHIDCTVSIKCKGVFAAKFWVTIPDGSKTELVEAKNYKANSTIAKTENAPTDNSGKFPQSTVINGVTYVFDGWYNEAGEKVADANWPYTPNSDELADGTVNFYAHYSPLQPKLTITKKVAGNMGEYSDVFNFTLTIGDTESTFTLKHNESETVEVPVGYLVKITEAESGYTMTYVTATTDTSFIATQNGNEISFYMPMADTDITITNTLEATPETGIALDIAPYVVLLATVAVGFVLMAGKKRYI